MKIFDGSEENETRKKENLKEKRRDVTYAERR